MWICVRTAAGLVLAAEIGVLAGTPAPRQEHDSAAARTQVTSLISAGEYEKAEASARMLVSRMERETGAGSLSTVLATDLLVEALIRNGKSAQPATRELATSALRDKERILAPGDIQLAASVSNLAAALMAAGESRQSLPLFERALSLIERVRGPSDIATAAALDDLGRAQLQDDRYDDAKRSLDRALRIKETLGTPNDRKVATTVEQLALLLQKKGDYRGARALIERALHIREAVDAAHPALADTLNLMGDQMLFEGEPLAARPVYTRALDLQRRYLRPDHPAVATTLRNLAQADTDVGDFAQARMLQEHALSMVEATYGPAHPELVFYLNDLANTNLLQGRYVEARVLYERATKIVDEHRGSGDLSIATFVYNLAILDTYLGDHVEARRQLDRAVAIWQRVLGPDHPYVARAYYSLGLASLNEGRYPQAQLLFERALRILEQRVGPNHREIVRFLEALATSLERQGQVSRASQVATRAVDLVMRSDSPDTPSFATVLNRHGSLQIERGDFESARVYYERALAIRDRAVGRSHPLFADTQIGYARAIAGLGNPVSALESALEAEGTARQHLRLMLRYLPERQSLRYASTRPKGLDLALSLNGVGAPPDNRVLDALIRSRALVLDEMAARGRIWLEESRPEVAALWVALSSSRQRLANLVVKGPSDGRPEQYTALVEDARREKELAERTLADRSATFRDEIAREEIGLDDVRRALPAGSALVAFARYDRTIVRGGGAQAPRATSTPTAAAARRAAPVPSYAAFVIREGQSPIEFVPIGPAVGVDALVSRWHAEMLNIVGADSPGEVENAYRVTGTALRRRVWDPLASHLKDASAVFVVPDGTLNLLSLAALPVGRIGYVIDQGPVIHYLSAERDLVTSSPPAVSNRGLLAVGGAAFDDATLFTGKVVRPRPATRSPASVAAVGDLRASCGDLASLTFDPLAGTLQEVREVARLWSDSPADVLQDRGASEGAFKRAAPGHRVLHLATHGFFLGSACQPAIAGTRAVGGLALKRPGQSSAGIADNPLLLSGLALAGANRRAAAGPRDDDGILTAEEVAALDLRGVEWAVLSACDTGLGEMKAGEGVFGLRRAFQIAGARTVIMSLWSVDDDATRVWMRALYEGRLKKHLSTADAMQQASLSVLRARRARGESTHPFYWAGFVAAGDWR